MNDRKITLLNLGRRLIYCALVCLGATILYWIASNIFTFFSNPIALPDVISRVDSATAWFLLVGLIVFMILIELLSISYVMYKVWKLPRIVLDKSDNIYYRVTGNKKRAKSKVRASLAEIYAYDNMMIIRGNIKLQSSLETDLLIEESDKLNAYTLGTESLTGGIHAICISSALINKLPSTNIAAVLGHELGHVLHKDSATKLFMSGIRSFLSTILFAPLYLLYLAIYILHLAFRFLPLLNIFSRFFLFFLGLLMSVVKFLELLLMWPAILYELHVSRHSEYLADAVASRCVGPLTTCRLFFMLEQLSGPSTGGKLYRWTDNLKMISSTHPSMEQRINAIQKRNHARAIGHLSIN